MNNATTIHRLHALALYIHVLIVLLNGCVLSTIQTLRTPRNSEARKLRNSKTRKLKSLLVNAVTVAFILQKTKTRYSSLSVAHNVDKLKTVIGEGGWRTLRKHCSKDLFAHWPNNSCALATHKIKKVRCLLRLLRFPRFEFSEALIVVLSIRMCVGQLIVQASKRKLSANKCREWRH